MDPVLLATTTTGVHQFSTQDMCSKQFLTTMKHKSELPVEECTYYILTKFIFISNKHTSLVQSKYTNKSGLQRLDQAGNN
jgi:hypothetical protein